MHLDGRHPANARLVEYFRRRSPDARPLASPDSGVDPYYEAGAHPDVVEYLWDTLGRSLPANSRCLLYGVPALLQPASGIVLGVAMGTSYAIRVPGEDVASALAKGYRTVWDLRTEALDLASLFGADWVWGRYQTAEAQWIRTSFERTQRW